MIAHILQTEVTLSRDISPGYSSVEILRVSIINPCLQTGPVHQNSASVPFLVTLESVLLGDYGKIARQSFLLSVHSFYGRFEIQSPHGIFVHAESVEEDPTVAPAVHPELKAQIAFSYRFSLRSQ